MHPFQAPHPASPPSLPPYAPLLVYASTSAAPVSAPAAAAPESKRIHNRLPKEALEILRDFHKNVGDRPNAQQKTELVKKVNSIPGGEHYTRDSVSRYFACKRRERGSAPQQSPKSATQSYLWPSLTEQKIERLRNLWAEKRHPNKKVIGIWAQSLGVEESHINAWLAYQSDEDEDDDNAPATDGQREQTHLPTPEPTASPEPTFSKMGNSPPATPTIPFNFTFFPTSASSFQAAPPGRQYPAAGQYLPQPLSSLPCHPPQRVNSQPPTPVSPVAPNISWPTPIAAQKSASLKPDVMSPVAAAAVLPAPHLDSPVAPPPSREEILRRRMQSVARDVMSRVDADDKDVLSLSEYNDAQLASVLERECTEFLSKAESGRYTSLGLKASMVPPRDAFEEGLRRAAA